MRVRREYVYLALLALVLAALPHHAFAAYAGTGAPWDTPFQKFISEITGPIPFIVGVVAMVGSLTGVLLARHEMNALLSTLMFIILIVSILTNIVNFMMWMGGSGAIV